MRTRLIATVCLVLIGHFLTAQEEEKGPDLFIEFSASALLDVGGNGTFGNELYETLGYGWGIGLQTSVIFNNGFGLVFRGSNDVISLAPPDKDELEDGLPNALKQSIYQGITYVAKTGDTDKSFFTGFFCYGWTRYRVPTVKYEDGSSYQYKDVSGFSTLYGLSYQYQYSARSRLSIGATFAIDFISFEHSVGQFSELDDTELFTPMISIGHVTKL